CRNVREASRAVSLLPSAIIAIISHLILLPSAAWTCAGCNFECGRSADDASGFMRERLAWNAQVCNHNGGSICSVVEAPRVNAASGADSDHRILEARAA